MRTTTTAVSAQQQQQQPTEQNPEGMLSFDDAVEQQQDFEGFATAGGQNIGVRGRDFVRE